MSVQVSDLVLKYQMIFKTDQYYPITLTCNVTNIQYVETIPCKLNMLQRVYIVIITVTLTNYIYII